MTSPRSRSRLPRGVSLLRPRSGAKADPKDLDPAPPHAMVVDDDEVFRTVVRAYLEAAGFRVDEAESGPAALERFEEVAPDIVLLDLLMPGMDGFDTCAAIRDLSAGRQTPIVMMTGVEDGDSIERAYGVGATDFIVKPVNSFILTHRLQHILRANRYLVHFDGLTALPKRELFLEHLDIAIAHARRSERFVAVLFLDLDDFKRFNDTLGHKAGDQILRQVADRLGELRASDYFARNAEDVLDGAPAGERPVGRYGGDEFMVLLPDIRSEDDMAIVARRVNELLSRPFQVGSEEIHVTASVGISAYPLDGSDPGLLLERAELAMNHSKRAGRGRYQFYGENLNARTQARFTIESDLRRALERDQLEVHYQPRIDIQRNRVAGVEALCRMPSAASRSAPSEFVPVAEDTGLIVPLGDWVFRNACEAFTKIVRPDRDFGISINLSAVQFRQEQLAAHMASSLEAMGLAPECVELELTEHVLLEDTRSSLSTLSELKDLGFRIAVDDFGTGYSCLSYLKRLPLDVLKIDQIFVRELPEDEADCAIVEAIIDLGHKLSLEIVAEGVEHEHQLDFLRSRGCDQVQGYHFCRPLPLDALDAWLSDWESRSEQEVMSTVLDSLRGK